MAYRVTLSRVCQTSLLLPPFLGTAQGGRQRAFRGRIGRRAGRCGAPRPGRGWARAELALGPLDAAGLHGERDAFLRYVHSLDAHLDDISGLNHLARIFDEAV